MSAGRTGTRVSGLREVAVDLAQGVADRGDDRRGRRDARRLADALGAERRLRIGLLDQRRHDVGHVEHRRQQVVGEAGVADRGRRSGRSPPSPPARGPGRCRPRSGRATDSGLSARPTSWAVATCTTLTRPSSGSTSTTARWATNANAVWQLPWPFSSRSSVGRWRYSTVSSNTTPARRLGDRHRAASPDRCRRRRVPSIASRSGSMPCAAPTCSNSRSRTARQAASTAPPLIHVWRDADVEPAEPIAVSIGSSTTSSTPSIDAGDLRRRS